MTGVGGVGGVGGGKWKQLYLNNKKMDQLDQWKKKKKLWLFTLPDPLFGTKDLTLFLSSVKKDLNFSLPRMVGA